jgi:hypothetical protein
MSNYAQDSIDLLTTRYGDFNLDWGYKVFLTVSVILLLWELGKRMHRNGRSDL